MTAFPEVGFQCPKCGGQNRCQVKDSRPSNYHGRPTIRRRRACIKCKYRFTTYELIEGSLDRSRIVSVVAAARKIKQVVDGLITEYDQLPEPPDPHQHQEDEL